MLESLILGIILDHEQTGYDIKKCIGERFGILYKASFGSLYPALNRLVKKGFVTTREESLGGRKKIYYLATETGENEFFKWLSSPMEIMEGVNPNLIKIYFFNQLPAGIREQQLKNYERNNIEYLKRLKTMAQELKEFENIQKHYYKMSTLYFGILITQRTIDWCHHILEGKPLSELIDE